MMTFILCPQKKNDKDQNLQVPKIVKKKGTVHDTTVVFSVNIRENELVECMWYMYVIGTQHALVTP